MTSQMPLLTSYFPATTPCENGLFAGDGQIVAHEGSHNVKIHAEDFTFFEGCHPVKHTTAQEDFH